jgi:hypothetical protein
MRAEPQETVNLDDTLAAAPQLEEPTGLTVLLFRKPGGRPRSAFLQLDRDGFITMRSVQFRRAGTPKHGTRIIGFIDPATPTIESVAVSLRQYRNGAPVTGMQPLIYDGAYLDRLPDVITATAGRQYVIQHPVQNFPPDP